MELSFKSKLSHLGSCLSAVDLIDCVYKVKKTGEKFILSNGHAALAWYTVLEKHGLMNKYHLRNFSTHPVRNPKVDIHVSTGSLGHGLPIALGMAMARPDKNFYCMISDGECSEGSIWETLRIASEQKIYNLKVILNANGWGAYDSISLKPLIKRIKAFGFDILSVDGHNYTDIIKALKAKPASKPIAIYAKTTVEQLPFLKGQAAHYYVMNEKDYLKVLEILK